MFQKGTFLLDKTRTANAEVQLTAERIWVDLSLKPRYQHVIKGSAIKSPNSKSAAPRVILNFLDADGSLILESRPKKEKKAASSDSAVTSEYEFRFVVPEATALVRVGFSVGKHGPTAVGNSFEVSPTDTTAGDYSESTQNTLASGQYLLRAESPSNEMVTLSRLENIKTYFDVATDLDFTVVLKLDGVQSAASSKSALMLVTFLGKDGSIIESRAPIHRGRRGEYVYLSFAEPGYKSINLFAPTNCVRVSLEFVAWEAPPESLQICNQLSVSAPVKMLDSKANSVTVQGITEVCLDSEMAEHSYVPMNDETSWIDLDIDIEELDFEVQVQIDGDDRSLVNKAGILRVEFLDEFGIALKSRRPIKVSDNFGEFIYLDANARGLHSYVISRPQDCTKIRVGFRAWHSLEPRIRIRNLFLIKPVEITREVTQAKHRSIALRAALREASEIRVAIICDEFTFNSFKYEFTPIIVEPDNWRRSFELNKPDMFFCESAWSGVDSLTRPWKGQVYASTNFKRENRTQLLEIIAYCNENDIPTVFWNKEDPSHFEDRVHDFVATAKHFDYVFTTDDDCVSGYATEHNIQGVKCLPFATQPRIYNPSHAAGETQNNVVFAGSWYENHEQRSAEMRDIFDSILDQGIGLEIYDRYYGTDDKLHVFPEKYHPYLRPPVPHRDLAQTYKNATYGLNINTVTDSSTMFARRVFELMSSNTLVMSNYSKGIDAMFGDGVEFVGSNRGTGMLSSMSRRELDEIRDRNLHRVLSEHTYEDRFRLVLDTCGIEYNASQFEVTLVGRVGSHAEISDLIALSHSYGKSVDRLLILLNDEIPRSEVLSYYMQYNRNGIDVLSEGVLELSGNSSERIIQTGHFAFIDLVDPPTADRFSKAILHRKYVDCPILIESANKYSFSDRGVLRNVVAPGEFFVNLIGHYQEEVSGRFYHV